MDFVASTGTWLKAGNILVSNEWLQACIEWIHEDNQDGSLSENVLRNRVYEQWLLADLRDLESSCLPQCIQDAEKFELSGAYALQIDSILDVGLSYYSQQQKIKGKENANVLVNADDPNQKPWEPKPSRMLLFNLTDGTINIRGMEYQKITCLNQQTRPGSKIIVHGKILCRHGMLMLCEDNIKYLGGEVDTLVETNTLSHVLQSAMEASREHGNKSHRQTFSGTSNVRRNNQTGKLKKEPVSQTQAMFDTNDEFSDEDDYLGDINTDIPIQSDNATGVHQPIQCNNNRINSSGKHPVVPNTEQVQSSFPNRPNNSVMARQNVGLSSDRPCNTSLGGTKPMTANDRNMIGNMTKKLSMITPNTVQNSDRDLSDDIMNNDIDEFDDMNFEDDLEAEYLMMAESRIDSINANEKHLPKKSGIRQCQNNGINQYDDNGISQCPNDAYRTKHTTFHTDQQPVKTHELLHSRGNQGSISIKPSIDLSTKKRVKTEHDISNQRKINSFAQQKVEQLSSDVNPNISDKVNCSNHSKVNERNPQVSQQSVMPNASACASSYERKTGRIESFFSTRSENIKVETNTQDTENVDIDIYHPFTYLSKVMTVKPCEQPQYFTVKAYISTLTSKLSSTEGRWTLSCKINDGTMAVDVDLSDQVLTEMIGISTKQSMVMRQKMKTDPSIKKTLQKAIQQCQQKLIELMCLLELEICVRNPRPVIVAKKPIDRHHIDLLYHRVLASQK
ncbi:recQ-mediated genome instability protein 1 [Mactra antiquata]